MTDRSPTGAPVPPRDISAVLTEFGDRWNPMLVRELRRMVKSRAFGVTFVLLVICCLSMTWFMVTLQGDQIHQQELGRLFCSYFMAVLAFPVLIVVPMSLFTAVSQEHTEQTLEMLSITQLKTEQIVSGYLWCGIAHAGFYYSAILPFICFSYLLRGLGPGEVLAALLTTSLAGLTAILWGLMLGTCAKGPIARACCSLLTVGGSLVLFMMTLGINVFFFSGLNVGLISGVLCLLIISFPCLFILFAIACGQLRLTDPLQKPYRVLLDASGRVTQFQPRYIGISPVLAAGLQVHQPSQSGSGSMPE